MAKVIEQNEDVIIVEDDGGFINVFPKQKPAPPQKKLTKEEQEELNKKLDELGVYGF